MVKAMKVKLIIAAMLMTLGSTASYAQYTRRVTSDWEATITEEQKLGPTARSHRVGNAVITTRPGWGYSRHAHYYRRHWR
jgi:hypothetical protein